MVQLATVTRRSVLCAASVTTGILLATLATSMASSQTASGPIAGAIDYGYWGNARRAELTEAVSRAFEAANPGTQVQGVVAEYNAYIERLTVQAAAKELPCVTQTQTTFLATYAARGVLRPLDDLVKAGAIDVSGIDESVLETGRVDGKLYMIPTGTFLRLVAVNAGMAQQNGLPMPPKRTTFDEFKKWALEVQPKLPKGVYAAENEGALLFTLYSWIAGHGQSFFKDGTLGFSPDLLAKYFDYWEELRLAGAALPADRLDEQFGALELQPLAKGAALSATRDIPQIVQARQTLANANLPSDIQFVRNPTLPGVKSGNVPGANGLSISANCTNVPTAAAYLNFFSNAPKAAIAFQSANGVVVSKSGQEALLSDPKTPDTVRASLLTLAELVKENDIAPAIYPPGYQALQSILRRAYESVALKGQKTDQAAAQFMTEATRALRSARPR
jgi:multiple sugar transport system substrate-binding protein